MNSDMAKAILAKVQEKKANSGFNSTGERKPWGRPADYNPLNDAVNAVGSWLSDTWKNSKGFRIGPATPNPAVAEAKQQAAAHRADAAEAVKRHVAAEIDAKQKYFDAKSQGMTNTLSNIWNAPFDAAGHVTKSVGDYFTRNPIEQQVAELAKKRIDSIGGAEQADMARRVLLGSLGVGLGAGGLYALYKALNRPKLPKRDDEEVALQYPVERTKAAESSWLESLLGKQQNPSVWDNPLFIPGLTLGGLGAVYGGLRGSTYLADKLADKARKDELAKAKREFHDALISGYSEPLKHDPLHGSEKLSSDNTMTKLSETLDSLYDACFEKKALDWTAGGLIPTTIAAALPTYLTLGSLAGLGAGSMAYDATKKHSKAEALKKALRERARLKYEQSPPELYISPEAIDVSELKKQRSSVV